MGLVNEVGLKLKQNHLNRNWKKYEELSDERKSQVVDFYYRTDLIYTAPGLKDGITVWTEKGRGEDEKILSVNVFARGVSHV